MNIVFDENAKDSPKVKATIGDFLSKFSTLEEQHKMPIIVFQDGINGAYYIKCSLKSKIASSKCDLNAKLDIENKEGYRANRELLLTNQTYLKMESDANNGREFNDIIVEYNTKYDKEKPLKIWGGQHRINAISNINNNINRYHGFKIYFNLDKKQRTEVALISNTNISVSNDTFDRMIEETFFGNLLRIWSQKIGFLKNNEDFPDVGSRSEHISVKKARSFVVNFYMGKEKGKTVSDNELDKNVYEPYLVTSGIIIDTEYEKIMKNNDILNDEALLEAGKRFLALHNAQYRAISDKKSKVTKKKSYRNKAMIESVLCGWSFVAGLLQSNKVRLKNHYTIPKVSKKIQDPLNAKEMSDYKHDSDSATYRGLGTRTSLKDRQRVAQLFLAKSAKDNVLLEKSFINSAVSQVVGLLTLARGYSN